MTPWPYPDTSALPALEGDGVWHREGFVAAVLTGSALLAGDAECQRDRAERFLHSAVAALGDVP